MTAERGTQTHYQQSTLNETHHTTFSSRREAAVNALKWTIYASLIYLLPMLSSSISLFYLALGASQSNRQADISLDEILRLSNDSGHLKADTQLGCIAVLIHWALIFALSIPDSRNPRIFQRYSHAPFPIRVCVGFLAMSLGLFVLWVGDGLVPSALGL